MKKLAIFISGILISTAAFTMFAAPFAQAISVQWDRPAAGRINPLNILDTIYGNQFVGTSTTLANYFPHASSTLLSALTKLYVGSTSTTTIDSAGNIVVPSAASITATGLGTAAGTFIAADASGKLIATTTPTVGGVTSVGLSDSNSTLTIGGTPITTTGTLTATFNLGHTNIWTILQRFSAASTTLSSVFTKAYFGGTSTTTIDSTGAIVVPSAGSITATGLGTAAGTFVAADATGKLIATSTPAAGTNYWTLTGNNISNNNNSGNGFVGISSSTPYAPFSIFPVINPLFNSQVVASTSVYSAAGTYTWNTPVAVGSGNYVVIQMWGGGGGGGGCQTGIFCGAGGGGAGAFIGSTTIVLNASSYTLIVGAPGTGGTSGGSGTGGAGFAAGGAGSNSSGGGGGGGGGGSSSFGSTIIAAGGGGGSGGNSSNSTNGGSPASGTSGGTGALDTGGGSGGGGGGAATAGSGVTPGTGATTATGTGGSGAGDARSGNGGGGGSSAGVSGNGNSASTITGGNGSGGAAQGVNGTLPNSGGGGAGSHSSNATAGGTPGAGGGGGENGNAGTTAGASGGAGTVMVTVYAYSNTFTPLFAEMFSTQEPILYGGVSQFGSTTIGVGTTTPQSTLDIYSSSNQFGALLIHIIQNGIRYVAEQIDQYGHLITGGKAPTCGTNCAAVVGDDRTMQVTTGSSVTSITVNFANAWPKSPMCIPTETGAGTVALGASTTVSTVVVTAASALTTQKIGLICQQSTNATF